MAVPCTVCARGGLRANCVKRSMTSMFATALPEISSIVSKGGVPCSVSPSSAPGILALKSCVRAALYAESLLISAHTAIVCKHRRRRMGFYNADLGMTIDCMLWRTRSVCHAKIRTNSGRLKQSEQANSIPTAVMRKQRAEDSRCSRQCCKNTKLCCRNYWAVILRP